jgi:DNA-binding NarL/FixJ family response regulator
VASPILRETIKKLKARRALLRKQVKGPLEELAQIEEDLVALGPAPGSGRGRARGGGGTTPRRPPGAHQAAILRAVRNGATEPDEIAERTGLAPAAVKTSVTTYTNKSKLLTRGPNGLTLTKAGRMKLAELEAAKPG